jgi:hypothetical protein
MKPPLLPVTRSSFCTNSIMLLLGTAETANCFSVSDSVQILWRYCPAEFRHAVQESEGRFLYRGESKSITCPTILNPKPDLLLPSTYHDPNALLYFEWLEKELITKSPQGKVTVRPSTGHIGTANEEYARAWGEPVSVWPLGGSFSYLWPRNRDCLYPGGGSSLDDIVLHRDLALALRTGKEVLFSTSATDLELRGPAFLACPKSAELQLRQQLEASNYGLWDA